VTLPSFLPDFRARARLAVQRTHLVRPLSIRPRDGRMSMSVCRYSIQRACPACLRSQAEQRGQSSHGIRGIQLTASSECISPTIAAVANPGAQLHNRPSAETGGAWPVMDNPLFSDVLPSSPVGALLLITPRWGLSVQNGSNSRRCWLERLQQAANNCHVLCVVASSRYCLMLTAELSRNIAFMQADMSRHEVHCHIRIYRHPRPLQAVTCRCAESRCRPHVLQCDCRT
jgi:hypothetical protein